VWDSAGNKYGVTAFPRGVQSWVWDSAGNKYGVTAFP